MMILFNAIGFLPGVQWSVDLFKNRKEPAIYKGETIHKTTQKHRIHKIENKFTKQKTNIKRILKNISRVIKI